jgi:hypothetical protein
MKSHLGSRPCCHSPKATASCQVAGIRKWVLLLLLLCGEAARHLAAGAAKAAATNA